MTIIKPTIGATGWGPAIRDLIDEHNTLMAGGGGGGAAKAVRVYQSAAARSGGVPQPLTANVDADIDMTTTAYNDDTGVFTVNLPSNSITVLTAGIVIFTWEVSFLAVSTAGQERYIYLNKGSAEVKSDDVYTVANRYLRSSMTGIAKAAANDVFKLLVWQDTAATISSTDPTETGLTLLHLPA